MKKYLYLILAAALMLPLSCKQEDSTGTLPAPSNVKAVYDEASTSITVTWDAVPDAVGYVVYYNIKGENSYSKSDILKVTEFVLSKCSTSVTYEFKVRTANNDAVSQFAMATVDIPKPPVPETPVVATPVVTNVRAGLGWVNFTVAKSAENCTYQLYDGSNKIDAVFETISEDTAAGTQEISVGGLELGKSYTDLQITGVAEGYDESTPAALGKVTMGNITVFTKNLSPRHLGFEWDDVAGNANWTFDATIDPLTRTYKIELAKDAAFKNIVYSFFTVNNYDATSTGSYSNTNWVGESGTPLLAAKPYANSNTNIELGQLEPSTTYYFRVRNAAGESVPSKITEGTIINMAAKTGKSTWSAVVKATTQAAHKAVSGELLFQGFDDHAVNCDHINCAAGAVPVVTTAYQYPWTGEWCVWAPGTGKRYDEIGASVVANFPGNDETSLDGLATYAMTDVLPSMKGWFCAKACYPEQGALKIGGSAGQKNYIITPAFSTLTGDTPVTISCDAGAAHATSTPSILNIKIYRAATKTLENVTTFSLPASASILNPDGSGNGYHNCVDMQPYSVSATLSKGDYVLFECETVKTPVSNRLVIDNISIVKK
jgi:hypothetical protein